VGAALPRGYACSSVDDLLVAFRLIDRREAVLKPLYGKEGRGVAFVSSPEELRLCDPAHLAPLAPPHDP
jgi:glutathione synthase/RimK-type ligase-like ATP-grasp enzyme